MMKLCVSGLKLLVGILCLALLPAMTHAATVVVSCPVQSITAALASLPAAGPNTILVSGTCHENVRIIGRTDLQIVGNPSATVQPGNPSRLLVIFGSQRIGIQGITFDGGRGVLVNDNSRADFNTVTVQNSLVAGLVSIDSLVHISNSTINNNTGRGISISGGSFYVDSDVTGTTITGNRGSGVVALTAHLTLNGGDGVTPGTENVISHNGGVGVAVANSGEGDINGDNRIIFNGGVGLEVFHTSTVLMGDGSIKNNTGIGVHCGETSHCEWFGATQIDNNGGGGIEITDHSDSYLDGGIDISGNTGTGVLVDLSSLLNSLGGNTINNNTDDGILVNNLSVLKFAAIDTITGNSNESLECANQSLVVGDISSLKHVNCDNIAKNEERHRGEGKDRDHNKDRDKD